VSKMVGRLDRATTYLVIPLLQLQRIGDREPVPMHLEVG
jgi:hypothetical protein